MLSRVAGSAAAPAQLDTWDAALAAAAEELVAARAEATDELAPAFAEAAAELGLVEATLEYAPRAAGSADEIARQGLEQRRSEDLELGRSWWDRTWTS